MSIALAPAGFLARGSIGSGAREGVESIADQPTALRGVRFKLNGQDYEVPTRLDHFALLNKSELSSLLAVAMRPSARTTSAPTRLSHANP